MTATKATHKIRVAAEEEHKADTAAVRFIDQIAQSEQPYRSLVELTADAVFCYEHNPPISTHLTLDEQINRLYEGVLVDCNDACAKVYGATGRDEVIGQKLTELFDTSGGSLDNLFKGFVEGGYRTIDGEGAEILPDGTKRYYLNNAVGFIENNALVRVWGTYRDITERKRDEQRLRESIERYELAVKGTNDGLWDWNIQTGEDFFSPRWKEILGYREDELAPTTNSLAELLHPDDRDRTLKAVEAHLTDRTPYDIEVRMRHKSGDFVWVRGRGQATWNEAGEPLRMAGSISDITAQRMAEHEAIAIGERERSRIGYDLHDGLGQELTGISLGLEVLAQTLVSEQSTHLQTVRNLREKTQDSISETRRIARSLSPGFASELRILEALESLASEVNQNSGVKCHVQCPNENDIQGADVKVHLYRIAQEAINNALRHGHPKTIELRYGHDGDTIYLEVLDDGIGIPAEHDRIEGLGLRSMRYRTRMVNGSLDVATRAQGGTRVRCSFNYSARSAEH